MKQYIKKSDYETVNLDDEWIIMNTDNFTVTKLNAIGGFCWTLLEHPQSISSLSQSIKQNYDLQNESLLTDVEEFLGELIEYGLVQNAV
ncbi:PqqD family protein [Metabacillus bambusae]|uniref:PqqD family protein n=1 Tax=Metabacillus bambusae TaxID=2795218 RepID=A0ABS3N290_9BACI|nr:PqqD family protein [Metabacillus bambusae]MBO1512385.1 PqqD family protein [Metabacillus bambusae]